MTRHENWPTRLANYLVEPERAAFVWGSNDCVLFAANSALHLTGEDPLGELRGSWTDEISALRKLHELGGLVKAVQDVLGPALENNRFLQRGDIGLIQGEKHPMLAVWVGDRFVSPTFDHGLVSIPLQADTRVWAIGR